MNKIDKIIERLNKDFDNHHFSKKNLDIIVDDDYKLKVYLSDDFNKDIKQNDIDVMYDIIKEEVKIQCN